MRCGRITSSKYRFQKFTIRDRPEWERKLNLDETFPPFKKQNGQTGNFR